MNKKLLIFVSRASLIAAAPAILFGLIMLTEILMGSTSGHAYSLWPLVLSVMFFLVYFLFALPVLLFMYKTRKLKRNQFLIFGFVVGFLVGLVGTLFDILQAINYGIIGMFSAYIIWIVSVKTNKYIDSKILDETYNSTELP